MSDAQARDLRSFVAGREPSIDRLNRPRPDVNQRRALFSEGIDEEQDFEETESSNSFDNDENEDPLGPTSSSCTDADEEGAHGALVYLRFRPTKGGSAFTTRGNVLIVGPSSEGMTTSNNRNAMEKQYVFSDIFSREIPQADVYENCVRLKIDTEDSFTLLTYGTSGSGKTYTLLGTEIQPGIIPRSLEHIFSLYNKKIYPNPSAKLLNGRIVILEDRDLYPEVDLRKILLGDCIPNISMDTTRGVIRKEHNFESSIVEDISVFVWISFIEIYNENVYDLLEVHPTTQPLMMAPPPRRALKIIGNDGNVFVKGLTSVYVKSSVEALHLLKYGLQHVNYAATSINHNSSRSHCIFTIDILKYNRQGECAHISYRFCDLAGSERLHKTGNVGSRLKEAQRINTSLLVLGRCLDAANSNSTRKKTNEMIPYRESKLTMLLQSALLGKEKLTMIVNIMATDKYYEENINVLGFASIAKNIVFKQPSFKMQKSRCSFLSEHFQVTTASSQENEAQLELLKENIFLRSEVSRLSDKLDALKMEHMDELNRLEQDLRSKLTKKHKELTDKIVNSNQMRFEMKLSALNEQWQQKYEALKNKYEWEIEELREELSMNKNARKRCVSDSSPAPGEAKCPTLDVEIVESDDEDKIVKSNQMCFEMKLSALNEQWQQKYEALKNKYKWEIEELSMNKNPRKRCVSDSPPAPGEAKRPTLDVEIVESGDEEMESLGNSGIAFPVSLNDNKPNEISKIKPQNSPNNNDTDYRALNNNLDLSDEQRTIESPILDKNKSAIFNNANEQEEETDVELQISDQFVKNSADEKEINAVVMPFPDGYEDA